MFRFFNNQIQAKAPIDLSYMQRTMKHTKCPICSHDNAVSVSEGMSRGGIKLRYVVCKCCSHIYMQKVPSLEAYKRFYMSGDYRKMVRFYKNKRKTKAQKKIDPDTIFNERCGQGVRLHNKFLNDNLKANDLVFDFGCGDGAWLYGLRMQSGCQINGNEPSKEDARFIKSKMGIDIFVDLIEDCSTKILKKYEKKAKLVIISGSLQHMIDPIKCLSLAHQILKKDGFLYICNTNTFEHYISKNSPYPCKFEYLRTVDHPHYFHEISYKNMMIATGFDILTFNNHSKIRSNHMEIFAQKGKLVRSKKFIGSYKKILDTLKKNEKEVRHFMSFFQRATRYLIKYKKKVFFA